jgi:membrane protein YqaA with SNARE-associated domain
VEFLTSPDAGLVGLFVSSFLAATLLPGGSEAVLFALLRLHPEQAALALTLATIGNTLGGMTTYWMARLVPQQAQSSLSARHLAAAERWGPLSLILAWAPLVGDVLCAAAGWLRLPWLACVFWMTIGKGLRYGLVVWGSLSW